MFSAVNFLFRSYNGFFQDFCTGFFDLRFGIGNIVLSCQLRHGGVFINKYNAGVQIIVLGRIGFVKFRMYRCVFMPQA